ncbi:MAG: FAD/NAD(P)-binding protein [Solirubrobacterales bacterium]|nr:FAD/NAD(P)-binding protein [Solirubrobacterales bacterium]
MRLAELARAQRGDGMGQGQFEVMLVDRAGETGGGVPHASTVSAALLLNDSITETDSSDIGLVAWLKANRARWRELLVQSGEPRATRWLERHRAEIDRDELGGLFLPRLVFGQFLRELWADAVEVLGASGISVSVLSAEAIEIVKAGADRWRVHLGGRDPLDADAVLLAVGNVTAPAPDAVAKHPGYLGFETARELAVTEPRLAAQLSALPKEMRRIAVLGSSAAATEFLYAVEGGSEVSGLVEELVVMSPSGRIPDGLPSANTTPHTLRHLPALFSRVEAQGQTPAAGLSSIALVEAVVADGAEAASRGYTIVDLLPAARGTPPSTSANLSHWFSQLFAMLPPEEKRAFVRTDYKGYRETIRHTSTDYAEAVTRLRERGALTVLAARVRDLRPAHDGSLTLRYESAGRMHELKAGIVVDCRGFAGVGEGAHPTVRGLLRDGTVRANDTGRGLDVDDDFAAAPGLFVLGPLLAGTAHGSDYIWFLENVPVIHRLAKRVALAAWKRVASSAPQTPVSVSGVDS